jgi:hypothetical protein
LGYTIEEEDEQEIICRHARKDTLSLIHLDYGMGVLAQILYEFPEQFIDDPMPLYVYANMLNGVFIFTKAYIHVPEGKQPPLLSISSVLEGDYDRKNFSIFLDNLEEDLRSFEEHPASLEIFGGEE